jgi:hypothetical protein
VISLHWTTIAAIVGLIIAFAYLVKESNECGDYGMPMGGCLLVMLAIIAALAMMLGRAWGLV